MGRMRKRLTAFMLVIVMLVTTGCSSGFYADELQEDMDEVWQSVSGNGNVDGVDPKQLSKKELGFEDATTVSENNPLETEEIESGESDTTSECNILEEDGEIKYLEDGGIDYSDVDFSVEEQHHIDLLNADSVEKFQKLYFLDGEINSTLDDSWWDNLTDDDRTYIEWMTLEIPEEDENYYIGQSLDECIDILETGVNTEEEFFYGNILDGLTLDNLYVLKNNNYTLYDLNEVLKYISYNEDEFGMQGYDLEGKDEILYDIATGLYFYSYTKYPISTYLTEDPDMKGKTYIVTNYSKLGFYGEKNVSHIELGGKTALCQDKGSRCRPNDVYTYDCTIENNSLGYFCMKAATGDNTTKAVAQICSWLWRGGISYNDETTGGFMLTIGREGKFERVVKGYLRSIGCLGNMNSMYYSIRSMYLAAENNKTNYKIHIFSGAAGGAQRLYTYEEPIPGTVKGISSSAILTSGATSIDKNVETVANITDTVTLKGFATQRTGKLKGWVALKSTGAPISGTEVEIPVSLDAQGNGTFTMNFTVDLTSVAEGDSLVCCQEYCTTAGTLIMSHKSMDNKKQTISIGGENVPLPPENGDLEGSYRCDTQLTTKIIVNKSDIETTKPLESVKFLIEGDNGLSSIGDTDTNGVFSAEHTDILDAQATWKVSTSSHEEPDGTHSDGTPKKKRVYTYTCSDCGTFEFSSSGDRDSNGISHCIQHATQIAEADLDAQVAAYTYNWCVTEREPRTSNHSCSLITGGNDSYTTGYHNNPIIT